jgi:hypothetical protein
VNEAKQQWPALEEAQHFLRHGRGQGIRVAILDSGVEASHRALASATLADDVAVD